MRAHVAAIGQQDHRMGHEPGDDLNDHQHRRDSNHGPRPLFRVGAIWQEIGPLTKARVIRPMHHAPLYNVILSEAKNL
jgi:hypothetical protein